ncbi:hypothetical protein AC579_1691 [Pseudocercospora musae]|uniref:Amidase domain-containing protein n=2 Tax=Pseudocercospora musae TaxID=113226 RepID=A0A139I4P7_9PEZI|nr:hypothetical protein AC579_1691 [Pseudocercospora musae]
MGSIVEHDALAEPQWLVTAKKKRQIQQDLMKPFMHLGIEDEPIINVNDVQQLARRVAEGKVKAYDVCQAYIKKAIAAHEKTNCLTEIMFDRALARASELDAYYSKHGTTIGPLHGVVMTLKDQFDVKGYDSTLGYVGRAFEPAKDDAFLVKILERQGAIFIAKTNLPQSIMWCETENPLFGLTTNPMDARLTPGGSTGGEGALLAYHGSLLGWGTDIGGSVRIPSHMMGLYGLKPSSGRLPYDGVQVSTSGQEHVPSVVGPLARSLSSIEFVTKLVINAEPWNNDPTCHRLPWRQEVYDHATSQPLVIGLLLDDGHVRVHPSIDRVAREVAAKLEAVGHIIIPWNGEGHTECIEVMDLFYTADGGEDIKNDVRRGGEPFLPHVEALVNRAPAISVYEYWALNRRKRAAQKAYLDKWERIRDPNTSRKVDVLLTPTMPHPAVPHRSCKWVGYTKVWNLLDYTALVLPAGNVDKDRDPARSDPQVSSYQPRNELDRHNWSLYDPEAMHGLPISVQIVGQRLEEEKVLGVGKVVDEIIRVC